MSLAIETSDVRRDFRTGFWLKSHTVLKGLSLKIEEHSVVGCIGSNGAGKTTFIHLLVGLQRPTQGSVRIFGQDPFLPENRGTLGYLPERPYLYGHLSARSFLRYCGELSGYRDPNALDQRISEVLQIVGLGDTSDKELRRFSKGMLQRAGIAQAILHDPQLIVLDEPMSGLDPKGRQEIRELIRKLSGQGKTIFFTTHHEADAQDLCTHLIRIEAGQIVEDSKFEPVQAHSFQPKADSPAAQFVHSPKKGRILTALAKVTLLELLRDRVLYNVLLCAGFLFGVSLLVSQLSALGAERMVMDFGQSALSLSNVILGLLLGGSLLGKEWDRRTFQLVLSRPVSRSVFLLGKFFGLAQLLALNAILLAGVYAAAIFYTSPRAGGLLTSTFFWGIGFAYLQSLVVTSIVLFFSTFSSASVAMILAIGMYVLGHIQTELRAILVQTHASLIKGAIYHLSFLIPNLEPFSLGTRVTYQMPIGIKVAGMSLAYGLLLSVFFLILSSIVIERREVI